MGMYSQNQKLYVHERKAQLKFNSLTISNTAEGCVNQATFFGNLLTPDFGKSDAN